MLLAMVYCVFQFDCASQTNQWHGSQRMMEGKPHAKQNTASKKDLWPNDNREYSMAKWVPRQPTFIYTTANLY
jgi:hypothetical protein